MKKGQNVNYKKEAFQYGLTEHTRGVDALYNFLNGQSQLERLNAVRKFKNKKRK